MTDKKEKEITIPFILRIFGLVFYLLLLGVGFLYLTKGNLIFLGIAALICLGIIFFASDFLEKLKPQHDQLKGRELAWLSILGVTALFSFLVMNHGIQIEFFEKNTIKIAARDKITAIDNLITDYEAEGTDRTDQLATSVEKDVDLYILSKGKNESYVTTIEERLGEGTIDFNLYPRRLSKEQLEEQAQASIKTTQDRMQQEFDLGVVASNWENYQEQAQVIFENWKRVKLGFYYYDIDNEYTKVYAATQVNMTDFDYADSMPNTAKIHLDNPFYSLSLSAVSLLVNLVIWMVVFALILAPYVAVERKEGARIIRPVYDDDDDGSIAI